MGIGEKIRKIREHNNLSQIEFAEMLGVSDSSVSAWELNVKTPRMGMIQKISDIFNVTKSSIIDEENDNDLREYDQDALDILEMVGGNHELKMLFKKVAKLSEEEKKKIATIIQAIYPEK